MQATSKLETIKQEFFDGNIDSIKVMQEMAKLWFNIDFLPTKRMASDISHFHYKGNPYLLSFGKFFDTLPYTAEGSYNDWDTIAVGRYQAFLYVYLDGEWRASCRKVNCKCGKKMHTLSEWENSPYEMLKGHEKVVYRVKPEYNYLLNK